MRGIPTLLHRPNELGFGDTQEARNGSPVLALEDNVALLPAGHSSRVNAEVPGNLPLSSAELASLGLEEFGDRRLLGRSGVGAKEADDRRVVDH